MAVITTQDLESAIAAETGQLLTIEMEMHQGPYCNIEQIINWKKRINGIRKQIRATISEYNQQ